MSAANYDILPHSASKDGPAGQGIVEGNEIPYRPEALKKKQENYANRQTLDTEANCYLPGVPRITYMPFPFQIIQMPAMTTILYEYVHATRYIYTNGSPHPPGPIEWWMGDSRGRWEGDTLVVDVTHFDDRTWFDRAGNYHSDAVARRRTLYACRPRSHQLRGDDRRSQGVYEALEDAADPLSPQGTEFPASGLRLLRVSVGTILSIPRTLIAG